NNRRRFLEPIMLSTLSRVSLVLVVSLGLSGCAPSASFSEVHVFQPVAREFSVAAPALPPAIATLGMQVAQSAPTSESVSVTAVTPEGIRVQITLRPTGQ